MYRRSELSNDSYRYDVDPASEMFANRRVFAYVDSGVPDGIQVGQLRSRTDDSD